MITRNQLAFYGPNGERVIGCNFQPTTTDMWTHRAPSDEFVVQLIGDLFTVYNVRTIRNMRALGSTIGLPVAEHEDYDTAVMTALLTQ